MIDIPYNQLIKDLHKHRKFLGKSLYRRSDGDIYQLLTWAHTQDGQLVAVIALCAHSVVKEIISEADLEADFELADGRRQTEAVHGRNTFLKAT